MRKTKNYIINIIYTIDNVLVGTVRAATILLRKGYLMKQYEYKVEKMFQPLDVSTLNKYGAEGWMLVNSFKDYGVFYFVFVREKQ